MKRTRGTFSKLFGKKHANPPATSLRHEPLDLHPGGPGGGDPGLSVSARLGAERAGACAVPHPSAALCPGSG